MGLGIEEVLCHEFQEGDYAKASAASNKADTGGGARDLRFRPKFAPSLDRLFPREVTVERNTPYRIGSFKYIGPDGVWHIEETVRYAFRPTEARPGERRIAQIDRNLFFRNAPHPKEGDGLIFVAFIRWPSGLPQMQYLTERQIRNSKSNRVIAAAMSEAMQARHGKNAIVFAAELR